MTQLEELKSDFRGLWKPVARKSPVEWCEDNITLDPRFSPRPGRFSFEFTPYLKKLHEWYGDRSVRQITFVKSAQVGGTTLLANLIQYSVAADPGPILYVTSTAENAKSWSERELIPRIRSCSAIRPLMPEDPDQFKKTEMQFKGSVVKLVGAQSVSAIASRPIRILLCDEVSKWPDSTATEAPALELAMARTIQFRNISKTVLVSTPTVETGAIWTQFLAGSRHRLHVCCPDCRHEQWLRFEQLNWSYDLRDESGLWNLDAVRESTLYHCEQCGSPWEQDSKRALIAEAAAADRWIPGNPSAPCEHRSAHISALYSPTLSWGDLAVLFLQKRKTPGGLHDFYNTYLGLPFTPRAATVEEEDVLGLRGSYLTREIPPESIVDGRPPILTLCADPGSATRSRTHWTVEARTLSGESWVIDYGVLEEMDDLVSEDFLRARIYTLPDGTSVKIGAGLVDSGWSAERVYSLCSRSAGLLYPSKGTDSAFRTFNSSPVQGFSTTLFSYSDFVWKSHTYLDRIGKKLPPLLHFPSDASREFLAGHSGQALIENRSSRIQQYRFKEVENDHYGDCTKLHAVAWAILREELKLPS